MGFVCGRSHENPVQISGELKNNLCAFKLSVNMASKNKEPGTGESQHKSRESRTESRTKDKGQSCEWSTVQ